MNGILFLNSFLSYVLVLVAFIAVGAIGGIIGYNVRKRKDGKESKTEE